MIKQEWAYLRKNKILLLVFLAIIAIPTIYTTLFLGSMWDPYGKVDHLPVAIVNEDKPVTYNDETLEVGNEMVDSLKDNESLDFHFVSSKEAKDGLKNGTYYMVITIPEDFSANASTVLDEHPRKMVLDYETNPGTNYIASKLSETALNKIRTSVADTVTKTYTETVFDQIVTVGEGMTEASDGAGQLADGAIQLADGNNTITTNLNVLANSSLTFKNGADTLHVGLKQYTDGVAQLNDGSKELKDGLSTLNSGASALASGVSQLSSGSSSLAAGLNQYTSGVSTAQAGADTLDKSSISLTAGVTALKTGVDTLVSKNNALNQGVAAISNGLGNIISEIDQMSASIPETTTEVSAQPIDTSSASANVSAVSDALGTASSNNQALISAIENSSLSEEEKSSLKALANNTQTSIETASSNVSATKDSISELPTSTSSSTTTTQSGSASSDALSTLKGKLTFMKNQIDDEQTGLASGIKNYTDGVKKIQTGLDGDGTLANPGLVNGIKAYTNGVSTLNTGLTTLNNNSSSLTSGVGQLNSGLTSLNKQTPVLTSGVSQLSNGSAQLYAGTGKLTANSAALISGSSQLSDGAGKISDGTAALADGSSTLGDGISQVKDGADTLASSLADGADEVTSIHADEETTDMFSSPVEDNGSKLTNVKNNGHGMAPYMMSVALWVAGIAFSIMYPLTKYHDHLKSGFSWWASKASVLVILSIADALLMIGCLHFFNGFAPKEMGKTMLVASFASLAFMSIMYFFNAALGKVGSFLMLIYMVVQLAGSAGTYPVELSGSFVPSIHSFLPFTYTVDAFRSTIAGGTSIMPCMIMLILITVVFSVLTVLLFERRAHKIKAGKPTLTDLLEKLGLA
ncbi:MAG: YhgE/Pip family protein [Christensenellales bacterium]